MNIEEFDSLSARDIASGIRSGALTPSDVYSFHKQHIDDRNKELNALRALNPKAKSCATQLTKEATQGQFRGRLHGVCFSAKDHIDVEGLPRSVGTKLYSQKSSSHSALLIQKLLAEGALCIGKGNMAEYGKSRHCENKDFGRTHNPFRRDYSPGGSTGGDAAAVAAHFASFGLGADSGGSIRVPANFCGLYGLHTTQGSLSSHLMSSNQHTTSALLRSFGLLTRSLNDCELLYSILAGYEPLDPFSVPQPAPECSTKKKNSFLYFSELNGVRCDREINDALNAVVRSFSTQGYVAVKETPASFAAAYEPFIILAGQAAMVIEDIVAMQSGHPRDRNKESDTMKQLRQRLETELPPLTAETVLGAWHILGTLRMDIAQVFESYDFILCPVAACEAPPYGLSHYPVDGQKLESQEVFQFSSAVNVLGLPAVAFPTGISSNGLALGLQIIGPRFSERRLCAFLREIGHR